MVFLRIYLFVFMLNLIKLKFQWIGVCFIDVQSIVKQMRAVYSLSHSTLALDSANALLILNPTPGGGLEPRRAEAH